MRAGRAPVVVAVYSVHIHGVTHKPAINTIHDRQGSDQHVHVYSEKELLQTGAKQIRAKQITVEYT